MGVGGERDQLRVDEPRADLRPAVRRAARRRRRCLVPERGAQAGAAACVQPGQFVAEGVRGAGPVGVHQRHRPLRRGGREVLQRGHRRGEPDAGADQQQRPVPGHGADLAERRAEPQRVADGDPLVQEAWRPSPSGAPPVPCTRLTVIRQRPAPGRPERLYCRICWPRRRRGPPRPRRTGRGRTPAPGRRRPGPGRTRRRRRSPGPARQPARHARPAVPRPPRRRCTAGPPGRSVRWPAASTPRPRRRRPPG